MTPPPPKHTAGEGRMGRCSCHHDEEPSRMVVLTGGPGAGKTAVLNLVRQRLCQHVYVVEEAASILFGGGFPRDRGGIGQCAAQRAIYHVQRELEFISVGRPGVMLSVCDRGTLDGLAYWPDPNTDYLAEVGTTLEAELQRYHAVIHLRTPPPEHYDRASNHLRVESAAEARRIDERIAAVWASHPRLFTVDSDEDFLLKAQHTLALIEGELAEACPHCGAAHGCD